jgi:hypothetical protein
MWTLQQYHDFLSFSDYVAREEGFRAAALAEAEARAAHGAGGGARSGSAG